MSRLTTANAPPNRRPLTKAAARATRRRAAPRWLAPLQRVALVTLAGSVLGAGLWWTWQAGWVTAAVDRVHAVAIAVTVNAGYTVADVMVEGRNRTDGDALLSALGIRAGDAILAFDLTEARERLERLPWVASATVERRLPDTVVVRLTEHKAMAIWQNKGKQVVIGRDGSVLTEQGAGQFPELPLVVGPDAPQQAATLLAVLAAEPVLQARVEAAVRVGGRRWDLRLDNGVTVKLPETDLTGALHLLADMEEKERLLERDVVAIDLRLPDRMVVQTVARPPDRKKVSEEKT